MILQLKKKNEDEEEIFTRLRFKGTLLKLWASLVIHMVKNPPVMWETYV